MINIFNKILRKYRAAGFHGLKTAIVHRIFNRPPLRPPLRPPFTPMPVALDTIFAEGDFTIIQIGAYIGDSGNDPLFEPITRQLKKGKGRLICVEPVKEHFNALVRNYHNIPNVHFENVAIAERSGRATFYRLGVDPVEHGYPEWLSQLSSLKKERMESLWDKYEANEQFNKFYLQNRI
jgi:FkbM family methyltransferase